MSNLEVKKLANIDTWLKNKDKDESIQVSKGVMTRRLEMEIEPIKVNYTKNIDATNSTIV